MNINDTVYLHITIHGKTEFVHLCRGIILSKQGKIMKVVIVAVNLIPVGQEGQNKNASVFAGKKVNRKAYQLSQKPPAWAVSSLNNWHGLNPTKTEEIINRHRK